MNDEPLASGAYAFACGFRCHARADHSWAIGTDAIADEPGSIVIGRAGRPRMVTLHADGRVTFGEGYNGPEAAREFWSALAFMPVTQPRILAAVLARLVAAVRADDRDAIGLALALADSALLTESP